eukprot:347373-Chlamydomonas_euryale.AAC.2
MTPPPRGTCVKFHRRAPPPPPFFTQFVGAPAGPPSRTFTRAAGARAHDAGNGPATRGTASCGRRGRCGRGGAARARLGRAIKQGFALWTPRSEAALNGPVGLLSSGQP